MSANNKDLQNKAKVTEYSNYKANFVLSSTLAFWLYMLLDDQDEKLANLISDFDELSIEDLSLEGITIELPKNLENVVAANDTQNADESENEAEETIKNDTPKTDNGTKHADEKDEDENDVKSETNDDESKDSSEGNKNVNSKDVIIDPTKVHVHKEGDVPHSHSITHVHENMTEALKHHLHEHHTGMESDASTILEHVILDHKEDVPKSVEKITEEAHVSSNHADASEGTEESEGLEAPGVGQGLSAGYGSGGAGAGLGGLGDPPIVTNIGTNGFVPQGGGTGGGGGGGGPSGGGSGGGGGGGSTPPASGITISTAPLVGIEDSPNGLLATANTAVGATIDFTPALPVLSNPTNEEFTSIALDNLPIGTVIRVGNATFTSTALVDGIDLVQDLGFTPAKPVTLTTPEHLGSNFNIQISATAAPIGANPTAANYNSLLSNLAPTTLSVHMTPVADDVDPRTSLFSVVEPEISLDPAGIAQGITFPSELPYFLGNYKLQDFIPELIDKLDNSEKITAIRISEVEVPGGGTFGNHRELNNPLDPSSGPNQPAFAVLGPLSNIDIDSFLTDILINNNSVNNDFTNIFKFGNEVIFTDPTGGDDVVSSMDVTNWFDNATEALVAREDVFFGPFDVPKIINVADIIANDYFRTDNFDPVTDTVEFVRLVSSTTNNGQSVSMLSPTQIQVGTTTNATNPITTFVVEVKAGGQTVQSTVNIVQAFPVSNSSFFDSMNSIFPQQDEISLWMSPIYGGPRPNPLDPNEPNNFQIKLEVDYQDVGGDGSIVDTKTYEKLITLDIAPKIDPIAMPDNEIVTIEDFFTVPIIYGDKQLISLANLISGIDKDLSQRFTQLSITENSDKLVWSIYNQSGENVTVGDVNSGINQNATLQVDTSAFPGGNFDLSDLYIGYEEHRSFVTPDLFTLNYTLVDSNKDGDTDTVTGNELFTIRIDPVIDQVDINTTFFGFTDNFSSPISSINSASNSFSPVYITTDGSEDSDGSQRFIITIKNIVYGTINNDANALSNTITNLSGTTSYQLIDQDGSNGLDYIEDSNNGERYYMGTLILGSDLSPTAAITVPDPIPNGFGFRYYNNISDTPPAQTGANAWQLTAQILEYENPSLILDVNNGNVIDTLEVNWV